jgi:hypothetical protein
MDFSFSFLAGGFELRRDAVGARFVNDAPFTFNDER